MTEETTVQLKPLDIVKLADTVNRLNMLLTWELATARAKQTGFYQTVRCELTVATGPFKPTIFFDATILEELIETQTIKHINELREAGIDISETLEGFRAAGEKLLNQQ